MRVKPDPYMADYPKIISTQQAIVASVFSTAAKVDETALRRRQTDKLSEILDEIRSSQARTIQ